MSPETITLIWLIAGLLLCGSELFVPALISLFLGVGALGVAGLRWLGLIESLPASFAVWILSSTIMVFALRRIARRLIKSESQRANVDEQSAEFGQVVEILSEVTESGESGRIRFLGTTWSAVTTEGALKEGDQARIVYRDNLRYVIEAVPVVKELEAEMVERVPEHVDAEHEVS